MRENEEFSNEAEPARPQAPIVIVQQSGRGWSSILVPPALILLVAVAILSYQIRPMTPPELILARAEDPPSPTVAANPAEVLDNGPIVVQSREQEDHSTPSEPSTEPEPEPEPTPEKTGDDRNPFDLPVAGVENQGRGENKGNSPVRRAEITFRDPEPEPEPEPDPELEPAPERPRVDRAPDAEGIWEDIEREARQTRGRREEVARLRDEQFQRDQQRTLEQIQKAQQNAAATRRHYLAELRTIVRHYGLEAAPYIAELTSRYGRDTLPEVHQAVNHAKADLDASRASPEQRISLLRHLGYPEPLVLDDVSQQMERAIGSRRGPANRNQAVVFAARKLLETPLNRPPTLPSAAQARTRNH
ncbi:hypothetical protein BH23PLA1_BH23PLA1_12860 [soil metagenome]